MSASLENLGGLRRKISVVVPAETVSETYHKLYRDVSRSVQLKGFRRGKIPATVIRKRFGEAILEDARSKLMQEHLEEAFREHDLKLATPPTPPEQMPVLEPTEALRFSFEFEVLPEFELLEPGAFALEVPAVEVLPEDVEQALRALRERYEEREDRGRAPAAWGDELRLGYRKAWEGQPEEVRPFAQHRVGDAQDDLPEFDAELLEMQAGETKTVFLEFGADHVNEALRGSRGSLTLEVHQVLRRKALILEELFTKVSPPVDDEPGLRAALEREVLREKRRALHRELRQRLREQIGERYQFEVPQKPLEERLAQRRARQAGLQGEVAPANVDSHAVESAEQDELAEEVKRELRPQYVLQKVAEQEELQADPDQLAQTLALYGSWRGEAVDLQSAQGREVLMNLNTEMVQAEALDSILKRVIGEDLLADPDAASSDAETEAKTQDAEAQS